MDTYRLKIAWKEFVERLRPDLFVTITFRTPTSERIAIRNYKSFFKFLNKTDEIYYNKFLLTWVVFERVVKGEGYHIHALIKGIDTSLEQALEKKLNKSFGSSKVLVYDYDRLNYSASEYLSEKYILYGYKSLEFYRINSRFRNKK